MIHSHVYTISPDRAFADVLAQNLLAKAGGDPLALAAMRILLPSRRAIRSLREAFLRASAGRPLFLPSMHALGDVDEEELLLSGKEAVDIPPAISPSRRILLLATLIWGFQRNAYGPSSPFDQAVRLASELARFMDEVQREERDMADMASLITGELAEHWQITIDFLQIIIRQWPAILAAEGRIDPVDRRNRLLAWLGEHWSAFPPAYPVIAAGTTGSASATARLLQVIRHLPQGMVILPALDVHMEEVDWQALEETHPQFGMAELLKNMGITRAEVTEFGEAHAASSRLSLLNAAFYPAESTHVWQNLQLDWQGALGGFTRLDCSHIQHEATVIALLLRDILETPAKTAALVTPNRELARRVAAILRRFHVEIDDSAGTPLGKTPGGVFLQLLIDAVIGQAAPIPLLALLKHPFAVLGLSAGRGHYLARKMEKYTLRGVRLANGLTAIKETIFINNDIKEKDELLLFVERLANSWDPLLELMQKQDASIGDLLSAHIAVAEALSTTQDGHILLWEGEEGEALAHFLHEVKASVERLPLLRPHAYAAILRVLLQGKAWRPRYGTHPRLHILSPMESRLQRFDRVVLAGLNEGSWPMTVGQDPWLSRPMRKDFGLPQPEEQIGLSSHDFYVLANAREVFLTRSEKEGGAASVPSRWLLRLEAVLGAQGGLKAKALWETTGHAWVQWAENLDLVENTVPCLAPAPKPPVAARPRELFVTRVETLLRNPYGLYASHILGLKKLDPIDKEPGAAEFGTLVHAAMENYLKQEGQGLEHLLACGQEALQPLMSRPSVAAIWWPRFERIAKWVAEVDAAHKTDLKAVEAEIEIGMTWQAPAGAFALKSRVDRLEGLNDDSYRVIDYKTGVPYKAKSDLLRGLTCQLLLGGAILHAHGKSLTDLQYWELKGGREESKIHRLAMMAPEDQSLEGWVLDVLHNIQQVIAAYDDPDTAYLHCPVEEDAPAYNDYEHLARPQEWGSE